MEKTSLKQSLFRRKKIFIPKEIPTMNYASSIDNNMNDNKTCLKLTRRINEKIIIEVNGEIIEIILSEIVCSNQIRLLFKATNKVKIDREEIYLKKYPNHKI